MDLPKQNPAFRLTPREHEVMELTLAGKDIAAIAIELSISQNTVQDYLSNARSKMGLSVAKTNVTCRAYSRHGLSPAEERVFAEVRKGITNRQIAENLFVCEKTVKFHLSNIYKILRLKSRAELLVKFPLPVPTQDRSGEPLPGGAR